MTESKKAYLEWMKSLNGEMPYTYNTWEAAVEWVRKREVYLELYTENNGLRTKLCLAEAKIAELRSRVEGRSSPCSIRGERDEARHENERLRAKLKEAKPEITVEQIKAAMDDLHIDTIFIDRCAYVGNIFLADKLHTALYPKSKPERKWHPCQINNGKPCHDWSWKMIPKDVELAQTHQWIHCPWCGSPLTDEGDEK